MPEFLKNRSNITLFILGALILIAVVSYRVRTSGSMATVFVQDKALEARIDVVKSFVAHKALYNIRLAGKRSGSQIVNISGQMLYDWHPSCDAWLSNHRFNMIYEYADSSPMRIVSNFSTFEAFDGSGLNYSSQRKRNGELFEELRGQASMDGKGAGQANFTLPEELTHDLEAGTLFPMGHTAEVARQIREGRPLYRAIIFDGSDEDGPVEVNSFIGKPVEVAQKYEQSKGIDLSLVKSPAHKVRLAFFPVNSTQETADYEMDLVFHDNGVISDMMIEYDDFTVSQKLIAIEKVETECESLGQEPQKDKKNR